MVFHEECFPSFLKYVLKNQERPYVKEKFDAEILLRERVRLSKPK